MPWNGKQAVWRCCDLFFINSRTISSMIIIVGLVDRKSTLLILQNAKLYPNP